MLNRRVLAVTALVAGGLAVGLGGPVLAGNGPQKDHVTGSAKFGPKGTSSHVWISAHSDADGQNAHGRFRLQQGALDITGKVTCMRVAGNRAIVGGEITASTNPALVGLGFFQVTVDNGSPGSNDRSQTFVLSAPPASCPAFFPNPAFQLTRGNYVVKDN